MVTIYFHDIKNSLAILLNISFCVPWKKESHSVIKTYEDESIIYIFG